MVRPNELSFARRGALNKLAARRQGARPSQLTAVFVGVDPEDDSRVIVSFDGSQVSVLAGPVKMVPGALCAVEVDSANAPVRVLGPVTTRPEGLDEDAEAPVPVTAMPELAPLEGMTDEQLGRLQDTADNLAQAQTDLALKADSSALAALAGVVEDLDIPDISGLASKAEMDAAAQAAEDAAKTHADLVSAGASADAIAAAAADAQSKADAAEAAAKAHADDRYDVLKDFADELQVVADQAAVDAAAAQARADAAQENLDALEVGGRNLIIRSTETENTWIPVNGQVTPHAQNSTSDYIRVPDSGVLTLTRTHTPGDAYFRFAWYDEDMEFISREARGDTPTTRYAPEGAVFMRVSYPKDAQVKAERGTKSTDWTPAPEDVDAGIADAQAAAEAAQADATAAHLLALDGEVALDRLISGKLKPTVVEALIADLAIIDYLEATEAWVGGSMMKDGAVTSRTLNVVPEEGTGGMELLPPGLRIIPADAEAGTAVSLRTDEENWLAFAKNGETTFSVDPDGDLVTESVEARQSLVYRGTELQESLNAHGRGIIAMARNTTPISIGSDAGRLLAVSFQAPSDNRMVTIQVMGRVGTSARRRAALRLKQSANGVVTPLNSTQKTWYLQTDWAESFDLSVTRSVGEWGWVAGDTVTLGVFVESLTAGESLSFSIPGDQEIIVKDVGPWLAIQGHAPWAPASGGGDGGGSETAPTPRAYPRTWNSTGHRTYSYTALSHVRAGKSLVQGAIANTRSRGHWIFDDADIRSKLNGADITSGSLTIRNQWTYGPSGMTAVLRYHNYSSAPSTFGTSTAWTTVHVKRGGTVTVPLTETILDGLQAGTIKGFSLDAGTSTSTTHYGYFSPSASLKINYRK